MNPAPVRVLFVVCSSLGLIADAVAAISTESPFLPKGGQPVASGPAENSPIELRGVMATPDGLRFGIYEPAAQKGSWVKANETGFGYVVRSYDAGKSAVTVDYQGRVQTLTLKEAKFDGNVAPVPMAPGSGVAGQMRPANPGAPAIAANPAEEAKRLEQVANEVRRRRAARQAATQQPAATPPPTTNATP